MRIRSWIPLLALALAATPALAYTIYLKDGSRIVAQEKYEVQGDLAIITLPSGTKSSLSASEIDVERTEKANKSNLGSTAVMIEGGEAKDLEKAPPPPKKANLQDLIRSKSAEQLGATDAAAPPDSPVTRVLDQRGRVARDGKRVLLADTDLAGAIRGFITSHGVTAVEVYRGAVERQPLLVFETSSEGAVFKALLTASQALIKIRGDRPGKVDGFEMVCETADGGLGARFALSPDDAAAIATGKYEITRYFVDNVQF